MENRKILFISQEITPYLPETEMSVRARNLPQGIQEKGSEIRTFMPRYGCVNERRNQLHEVIRLSGMNLIIDDTDHPLIIKVASIQAARMQVYFIDNEDYFQRKNILTDNSGNYFKDNDERAIFFARGVIETIRKLRWSPDLVHCHGWFTGMVPFYLKHIYHDDPLFADSKIVYSPYSEEFNNTFEGNFSQKAWMEGIQKDHFKVMDTQDYLGYSKLVVENSDGVIYGSQQINENLKKHIAETSKPVLEYHPDETYIDAYSDFYDKVLG
jgi:starch synthase